MNDLKINIFTRAKVFLENMNEFAPFGAKLIVNNIKDVVFHNQENENLDTETIIKNFQESLAKDLKGNTEIKAVGFAYDVSAFFNNSDGISEKRDALCLKISTDGENWTEEYFPYLIINGECIWR